MIIFIFLRFKYHIFFVPHYQWRIQDFPQGGAPTPKIAIIFQFFAKNCMKMKEFGPRGRGHASLAPPLDPPMITLTSKAAKEKNIYPFFTFPFEHFSYDMIHEYKSCFRMTSI